MIFPHTENGRARATQANRFSIIPPEGGDSWWVATSHQLMKLTGEQTGGGLALWIETVPPGGGPPPHRHTREDECFIVLEGEVTFSTEGVEKKTGAGAVVYLPRGQVHTFRNSGEKPARMMVSVTPAGFENFFKEVAVRSPSQVMRPPVESAEIDRMLNAAPRYGLEFVPPSAG
jgi:quercetin dioxygenase-like cupin family protein